jgi:glycine cleavage system H protein
VIVESNESLDGAEDSVNVDPYGAGWLYRIRPTDSSEIDGLMDAATYDGFVADSQ